jgi:maltose/moltooligosaccharide transporter
MGIINMMIVVPMILQSISFGYVLKNLLGNNPGNAVMFAGVLLLIAASATLFIRSEKSDAEPALHVSAH